MNDRGLRATIGTLMSSRKGVMVGFVLVLATLYAGGVVYAAVRGGISWDAALNQLFRTLLAQVAAAIALILGTAHEDAAKAAAAASAKGPTNVA